MIDKVAPGKLVPVGVGLASAGFLTFTAQVRADTPYWMLIGALSVTGVGVGMTIMPTVTAVARDLSHEQVPVASTALNIVQQISAAFGTALMSVLLATAMADRLPATAHGGLGAVRELPAPARHMIAPRLAGAFQHTYVWATALMAVALLPALLLPGHRSATAALRTSSDTPGARRAPHRPRTNGEEP
jgi:MFS family permease